MKQPGIFCLEGEWDGDLLDRTSVRPQLQMLSDMRVSGGLIHRDVATKEELSYYLRKWRQRRYANFKLGYFAFHGVKSAITLGREVVELDDLAEMLRDSLMGRIVYFGSCSTLACSDDTLKHFCVTTGAKAVVGYTRDIDWLEAAAFDFILIPQLLNAGYAKPIFKRLQDEHPRFVNGLGFRISTATWSSSRAIAQEAVKR